MIRTEKIGAMEYLTADSIGAPHCFTTRLGGVSEGIFASLNLRYNGGDSPENVEKNYALLASALGFSMENLVLTRQTHSDIVLQVDRGNRGAGLLADPLPECDALITDQPGLCLTIYYADCIPFIFFFIYFYLTL